ARAMGDTRGLVKFLADAKTDRILGMHAIGPMVSELIAEGVVAMEFGAASEDIARICHAHPSLAEAVKEAALAVDTRPLNLGIDDRGRRDLNDAAPQTAAPPGAAGGALLRHLEPEFTRRGIVLDAAQLNALAHLERLYEELVAFKKARQSVL